MLDTLFDFVSRLPLSSRFRPLQRPGLDAHYLFRHSPHPHDTCGCGGSARAHDIVTGPQGEIRSPSAHRAVDVSGLALRFRDRGRGLRYALQALANGRPLRVRSRVC